MNKLWVETYRPSSIEGVIFSSEEEKAHFTHIIKTRDVPNLLLVGTQGTGKTTISKALVNDLKIDSADVLKINCAEDQIDAIRNKVKTFAFTMPMGDIKIVRLEELDYLSLDAQALLRDLIESTAHSCRFIGTANYLNKIIPPIQSRFQVHQFKAPDLEQTLLRMSEVLIAEGVSFTVEDLETVVRAGYPDLRRVLVLLEKASKTKTLVVQGDSSVKDWKLQLLPLLKAKKYSEARALVCSSCTKEELVDVFRFLYDNVNVLPLSAPDKDAAIILIAQYMYKHAFVADPEINIAALFIEIGVL